MVMCLKDQENVSSTASPLRGGDAFQTPFVNRNPFHYLKGWFSVNKLLSLLVCLGFMIGLGAIAGCGGDTKDSKKTTTEKKVEEKKTETKTNP